MESKRRSIAKVISWRITGSLTTMVFTYFITGSFEFAYKIGLVELVFKIGIQYFHERVWSLIKFGVKPVDYQI
jgi:uncharacterized membrane protein